MSQIRDFWCISILYVAFFQCHASCQITVNISSLPLNTPADASLYLAGTMNRWDPANPGYAFKKDSTGHHTLTFTPAIGTHQFKCTRGSWDTAEGSAEGAYILNRSMSYEGGRDTITLSIEGWEHISETQNSTASPRVSIISDTFYMPQLHKKRRIWIYLPRDYSTAFKSYPVLYMQDGQNLFDNKTAFSGEWRVDESLDSLQWKGESACIVVGIDNGGTDRLNEYSPWIHPKYGGGEGDNYVDFLVQTLKPFIDQHYRTLRDNTNTGIFGSSMGGLISLYAAVKYPEVFGKVCAMSASYWFSDECFRYVSERGVKHYNYFYLIAGGKEGGNQVIDMDKMVDIILTSGAGTLQVFKMAHPDGGHSEWYWAREFPKAFKWLFAGIPKD